MNEQSIQIFLQQVLGVSQELKVAQIQTSGTNKHYLIETPGGRYFLKVFTTNKLQVVNRPAQFAMQKKLSAEGLAVNPLALSDDHLLWLEEAIEPAHPNPDSTDYIHHLAMALSRVHQTEIDEQLLDIEAEWRRYKGLVNQTLDVHDNKIESLLNVFKNSRDYCFCHNDLHFSHIVLQGDIKILDWEYAAIGNRYFDIAACCLVNELSDQQVKKLAAKYSESTGAEATNVLLGIERLKPVVEFTNNLWHNAYNRLNNQ